MDLEASSQPRERCSSFIPLLLPGANIGSSRFLRSDVSSFAKRPNACRFVQKRALPTAFSQSATMKMSAMDDTSGVIQTASATIHASFEKVSDSFLQIYLFMCMYSCACIHFFCFPNMKAVNELLRPKGPATPFTNCRQLVGAILAGKRNSISCNRFLKELLRYQHAGDLCSIPTLSLRQREIVGVFLKLVYSIDAFFDLTPAQRERITRHFEEEEVEEIFRLQTRMGEGHSVGLLAMQEYFLGIYNGCEELQAASRQTVPRRWRNIIICIVLEMKDL
ncbi:hypothetical protein FGB62_189g030 [Gracilaria domingensis]|nr:hypothetical protein FGB62_189g030 [Gracilaria domingensis]